MTLARHLIGRGRFAVGLHFTLPVPSAVTLTASPNGGNNPWVIAGAYQRSGVAVFGWVDSSGNIECATYTESSGAIGGPHTIHASFEADAHSAPAFLRRSSDGKILAVYSLHNGSTINIRTSSSADDPSAWSAATNLDAQLGGTRYTDYQLHQLSDGTIFLFYRDEPSAGTDSRWCYSTSTDGGATWAAQTILYRIASTRSYFITAKDPASDRIDVMVTNGASSSFTKLGHFYRAAAGTWHKSDGTALGALPYAFTSVTEAYSGGASSFMANLAHDPSGRPVAAGWDGLSYIYVRWSGSAWTATTLVSAGTGFEYSGGGTGFQPWGIVVDHGDPNDVYLLRDAGGNPSLYRYRTSDGGATFASLLIAATSGEVHTMVFVRYPAKLRAYFPVGSWTDYTDWATGLVGIVNP